MAGLDPATQSAPRLRREEMFAAGESLARRAQPGGRVKPGHGGE